MLSEEQTSRHSNNFWVETEVWRADRSVFDAASLRLFLGIRAIFTTNARFFPYCLSGRFVYRFHSPVFRSFLGENKKLTIKLVDSIRILWTMSLPRLGLHDVFPQHWATLWWCAGGVGDVGIQAIGSWPNLMVIRHWCWTKHELWTTKFKYRPRVC